MGDASLHVPEIWRCKNLRTTTCPMRTPCIRYLKWTPGLHILLYYQTAAPLVKHAAMATFNPRHRESWFFGPMSRQEATRILNFRPTGEFIVRESARVVGDYVLSVKEETRICHYIISRITTTEITFNFGQDINMFPAHHGSHPTTGLQQESRAFLNEHSSYKIGQKVFENLPSLLEYYIYHYLDTAYLTRPVPKRAVKGIREGKQGSLFEKDNKGFVPEREDKDMLFGKESSVVAAAEKESFFDREKYREHSKHVTGSQSFFDQEKALAARSVENRSYFDQEKHTVESKHVEKGPFFDQDRVLPPRPVENGSYFNQDQNRVDSERVEKAFAPIKRVENQSHFDQEKHRVEHREKELVPKSVGKVEKVIAKYNFAGRDPDDLPFRKHEILLIVSKHEAQWWTAMNVKRECGTIPANYVVPYREGVPSQPTIASQVPSQSFMASQVPSKPSHYLNLRS
uniref:Adapter molecule Crk n=1 Tax=Cacopsylla melanoneura TaxID=428564 RepID=A0A8D9AWV4_9HEMI